MLLIRLHSQEPDSTFVIDIGSEANHALLLTCFPALKQFVLVAHNSFPLANNFSAQRNKFLPSEGSLFLQNDLVLSQQQAGSHSKNCSNLSFQNKFHHDKN